MLATPAVDRLTDAERDDVLETVMRHVASRASAKASHTSYFVTYCIAATA
jgi:hypothetical protein